MNCIVVVWMFVVFLCGWLMCCLGFCFKVLLFMRCWWFERFLFILWFLLWWWCKWFRGVKFMWLWGCLLWGVRVWFWICFVCLWSVFVDGILRSLGCWWIIWNDMLNWIVSVMGLWFCRCFLMFVGIVKSDGKRLFKLVLMCLWCVGCFGMVYIRCFGFIDWDWFCFWY